MIDYRIRTFLTLYREMNYRRTAELLNMTQPGVTQHIHFLEKAYGTKLFCYDGKVLSRTASADILKRSMERILQEEQELEKTFQNSDEFFVRIGATKTIGNFVILPLAEKFLRCPRNNLELVVDNTAVLLTMLADGLLDFTLIEGTFDKNRFDYHLFKKENFVGICARNHRFSGQCISFEEMFAETLFVREKGSGTRAIMEQLLQNHNFSLESFPRVVPVSNFTAIQQFVAKGLGITFAYQPVVDADSRLSSFQIEDITVVREFNYVYCNKDIAVPKIKRFELQKN